MYVKSIFGQNHNNSQRNMINPLGDLPFQNNEYMFTTEHFDKLQTKYTKPLSLKTYDEINDDLLEYSDLYSEISKMQLCTNEKNIKMLLKISLQGLTGSIHAFHLNKKNIELNLENIHLKHRLETILSCKNLKSVNEVNSQLSVVKIFTLAPLYSYYIILFGIPENGFEPVKLNQIICFMNKYNIDPYQ